MLKEELAIQNLTALRDFFEQDRSDHITINVLSKNKKYFIENMETAIKALEKQIPKKIYIKYYKLCPSCGEECYWDTDYGQQEFNHCHNCGQALLWENHDD